eukprot:447751-Prorocentrum_lima.AAC.1
MTSSLVGSEMCIRDRANNDMQQGSHTQNNQSQQQEMDIPVTQPQPRPHTHIIQLLQEATREADAREAQIADDICIICQRRH